MIGDQKPIAIPDWFVRTRVRKFDSKLTVASYGIIICVYTLCLRKDEWCVLTTKLSRAFAKDKVYRVATVPIHSRSCHFLSGYITHYIDANSDRQSFHWEFDRSRERTFFRHFATFSKSADEFLREYLPFPSIRYLHEVKSYVDSLSDIVHISEIVSDKLPTQLTIPEIRIPNFIIAEWDNWTEFSISEICVPIHPGFFSGPFYLRIGRTSMRINLYCLS
jgi:hypothetical protein